MWLQATVRDLYAKKDLGLFTHNFTWIVPQHGVLAIKLTPSKCVSPLNTEHPAGPSPRPCMAAGHTALLQPYWAVLNTAGLHTRCQHLCQCRWLHAALKRYGTACCRLQRYVLTSPAGMQSHSSEVATSDSIPHCMKGCHASQGSHQVC